MTHDLWRICFWVLVTVLCSATVALAVIAGTEPTPGAQPETQTTSIASATTTAPAETEPAPSPEPAPQTKTYRGVAEGDEIPARVTYYCACSRCNGKWAGITADGTVLDEDTGPTVAINWLPLGSVVEIGGKRYTVHDRGGRGLDPVGRVDIYDPEGHAHALGREIRGDWVIKIVEIHTAIKGATDL